MQAGQTISGRLRVQSADQRFIQDLQSSSFHLDIFYDTDTWSSLAHALALYKNLPLSRS